MKKIFTLLSLCTLAFSTAFAQFASAPAFPGAEGYGRFTTGGRGGAVYRVTSLEDYKDDNNPIEGTLRYFISKKSGARTIVFDVAGTIELTRDLKINKGDISILGQTAPGQGICLKGYNLSINTSNVIIRFIRCRLGCNGGDKDAMSAFHNDDDVKNNIIIDHCSMSWCTDEVGSFYGNENFTLQWCILSESLKTNPYKTGTHGYAGIWGGKNASFHHNLLAHNDSRMVRFDHGYVSTLTGPVDYVNNVIYNWGSNSAYGGETKPGAQAKTINMINNYYKPGPSTSTNAKTRILNPTTYCDNCDKNAPATVVPGKFFITGNVMEGYSTITKDNTSKNAIKIDSKSPITYEQWKASCVSPTKFVSSDANFNYNLISQQSAKDAYSKVIAYAGASLSRDEVDERIANDAKNGTGAIMESEKSPLMSWPTLTGEKVKDTDGDGMPDDFEIMHGLEPLKNDASNYDLDPKKYYTNIEVYANSLVEDIVKSERELAEASFEEYYPVLGQDVYQFAFEDGANTLEYLDGAKIVLNGNESKTYTVGNKIVYNDRTYKSIKLSNGAQNTFYAPEGKGISSVKIISYKHGAGTRTTFWYEVNGTEYGTLEIVDEKGVFTPNEGVATITEVAVDKNCAVPNVQEFTIGGKPNFTFTNGGEQVAFILDVTYSDVVNTGISNIVTSKPQKVRKYYENGRIVIETVNGKFTTTGARLK